MNTDLTGKLLIAMPSIGDERFSRSVILLCAHEEDYAMGLVINKPIGNLSLPDLLIQLDIVVSPGIRDGFVLDGGPVGADRGFVLHTNDFISDGATVNVGNGICMTATREILHAMASDVPPQKSVIALGYSGWGPGQLEMELGANAWIVGAPDHDLLFDSHHADKWNRALEKIGVESGRLQAVPGRA